MKSKDCFYGQVRAVTETLHGTSTIVVPPALNVVKQEAITWDNATGMNPLYDKSPIPALYMSYANMLDFAMRSKSSYALAHLKPGQTEDFYHAQIKADYKNDYSMLCHTLAPIWMLHHTLSRPDVLEYDYIIARQFDTWFNYPEHQLTQERIEYILSDDEDGYTHNVLPNKGKDVPLIYAANIAPESTHFPIVGNIASYFLILNKEAVKILKDQFFFWGLQEMDLLYDMVGYSRFLRGNVGNVFFKVFTKANIPVINIAEYNICFIKDEWSPDCKDFSRIERTTGISN